MDTTCFVFLDETGATTNLTRRYGRCPRGERLVSATPWGIGRPRPSWPACAPAA
jgi:hypothetical protein